MAISASMVKELRERTGLGMMDCKRALTEAGGDMEKAIEELRKKSALKAAKKAGRTTANGLLGIKVADDGSRGAIVEINIETDFAAKNEKFIAFVAKVTQQLFDSADADLAALSAGDLNAERVASAYLGLTNSGTSPWYLRRLSTYGRSAKISWLQLPG